MQPKKSRWSKVYESSEEELIDFLDSRGLATERIHLTEFESTASQTTARDFALWCAEGSMTLRLPGSKVSVQPGDSVQLPVGSEFELLAGISGCVYYRSIT